MHPKFILAGKVFPALSRSESTSVVLFFHSGRLRGLIFYVGGRSMRLVLVSFAVMALVFYEMSGGSDFVPPEPPQAAEAPSVSETILATAPAPQVITVAARTDDAVETPAKAPPAAVAEKAEPEIKPATASDRLAQVRKSLSQGLTLVSDDGPVSGLSLVSLELGTAGLRPAQAGTPEGAGQPVEIFEEPEPDLREIIGTRVNMRDGPGTIYPVIGRVSIGQKVEVLSESGTGWLRLRTLPDQQLGWISSSLVSKPDR
jgi:hypothetical protein